MELTPIDLGNGILLFKNVLQDAKKTYEFVLDSKTNDDPYFGKDIWYDWQPWGNYAKAYPNESDEYKTSDSQGAQLQREAIDVFFSALKVYKDQFFDHEYFERYGYSKDIPTSLEELESRLKNGDHSYTMADMPLFETNRNHKEDWQMAIHQDIMFWWGAGKHIFNFNIYINDDYEGGELVFFKHHDVEKFTHTRASGEEVEGWLVEDHFVYKMEAGDAMLFTTDIYHGVLPLVGQKYYIRQFLTANDNPEMAKYKAQYSESEYAEFYEQSRQKALVERVTPIMFDSVDSVNLDTEYLQDRTEKLIPVVIKTHKDISRIR